MKSVNYSVLTALVIALILVVCDTKDNPKFLKSFINRRPRSKTFTDDVGPGDPLFLTKFITDSQVKREDIQERCKVKGSQFHGVVSYAGYLTVDEKFNSNMFFWYFPAEQDQDTAPVVLWLQGGPGSSSLFGLFTENGPFEIDSEDRFQKRYYTWSRTHNLIFIDNPVGTGFSFTDDVDGYARNQTVVGQNLHEAIQQLYELFTWTNSSGFWITGESYGGKYVPALAYRIHEVQNSTDARVEIPLKGMAIGNGFSDPINQLKHGDYLYQLGLIDEEGLKKFNIAEQIGIDFIKEEKMLKAFYAMNGIFNGNMSLLINTTGFSYYYNYLQTEGEKYGDINSEYLRSSLNRRALHVGNRTFDVMEEKHDPGAYLLSDIMKSVAPWISELLDTYTVCFYSGQLDIIVPYTATHNFLKLLEFNEADEYKNASRKIWRVDDEIAGYTRQAGNLIEVLVRNAGHMVPADQPKWMFNLIHQLTHYNKIE